MDVESAGKLIGYRSFDAVNLAVPKFKWLALRSPDGMPDPNLGQIKVRLSYRGPEFGEIGLASAEHEAHERQRLHGQDRRQHRRHHHDHERDYHDHEQRHRPQYPEDSEVYGRAQLDDERMPDRERAGHWRGGLAVAGLQSPRSMTGLDDDATTEASLHSRPGRLYARARSELLDRALHERDRASADAPARPAAAAPAAVAAVRRTPITLLSSQALAGGADSEPMNPLACAPAPVHRFETREPGARLREQVASPAAVPPRRLALAPQPPLPMYAAPAGWPGYGVAHAHAMGRGVRAGFSPAGGPAHSPTRW